MNDLIDKIQSKLKNLNYHDIISFLSPKIIFYKTKIGQKNYQLKQDLIPKNIKEIKLPPDLKYECSRIKINEEYEEKVKQAVNDFSKVLVEKFSKDNLIVFYNNINNLKICNEIIDNQYETDVISTGVYDTDNNSITINNDYFYEAIYHELFHMASSVMTDKVTYSGFFQLNNLTASSIGDGINEGYTEILTRRYFKFKSSKYSVEYLIKLVKQLEIIVGKKNMEKLYLNADLKGLVLELKQYLSDKEVMELLMSTDFILKYIYYVKTNLFEQKIIINNIKKSNVLLIKAYCLKLKKECLEDNTNINNLFDDLAEYCSKFPKILTLYKHKYEIFSENDLINIFKENFNNSNSDDIVSIKK